MILLRIQYFQQRRSRITMEIAMTNFINLIPISIERKPLEHRKKETHKRITGSGLPAFLSA